MVLLYSILQDRILRSLILVILGRRTPNLSTYEALPQSRLVEVPFALLSSIHIYKDCFPCYNNVYML